MVPAVLSKMGVAPSAVAREIETSLASLPKTQTGKLQRFELRKLAAQTAQKIAS